MLSVGKLAPGQQSYYLATVATSTRDYYLGAGEAPGRWTGAGAGLLGLGGEVDEGGLGAALAGHNPVDGEALVAVSARRRVPGFDLTFSAPKSASLFYALGSEAVAAEVVEAHEAAVDAGLDYLERHATFTRRHVDGRLEHLKAEGLTVAAFRHRTSRAGDPQLHTHALVANAVRSLDGRWGALDARQVYAHARTAGFVYQAVVRAELSARLGVAWGPVQRGMAEAAGMPGEVLVEFSQRRREIEQRLAERGQSGAEAAQRATLFTRRPKDDAPEPGLRQAWAGRAEALGMDRDRLASLLGHPVPEVDTGQLAMAAERLAGPEGLTLRDSTFLRRDVVRAWCEAVVPGSKVGLDGLDHLTDRLLGQDGVVGLTADDTAGGDARARADGRVVPVRLDTRRFSTEELLAVEAELLASAERRRDTGAGAVALPLVDAVVATRPGLAGEQEAMVRRLTTSGNGIDAVVGKAGSGKTFALETAGAVWSAAGYHVSGVALAARAAGELEAGAGIPSTTMARFLADLDRPGGGLSARSVVVADEAGMVDTRRLGRLLTHAEAAGAKVVLVGDHRQLPEVEAGGAFRALAERLEAGELTENRRQHEPWERDALDELRHGSVADAVASYAEHDRLVLADEGVAAREAMVADWAEARRAGQRVLMLAVANRDVADLNRRARAHLQADGDLAGPEVVVGERAFASGDEVLFLRNDRRLGVTNGLTGVVSTVDPEDASLMVQMGGRTVALPGSYVENELAHAYATTVHKAQGATVDRTLVLGDDRLYREAGYVGLSRGRDANHVYAVRAEDDEIEVHVIQREHADPLVDLVRALNRSTSKQLALERNDEVRATQESPDLDPW